jgi:D-alanyl-D-alanine dipeptidase
MKKRCWLFILLACATFFPSWAIGDSLHIGTVDEYRLLEEGRRLVPLTGNVPGLRLDIRYATDDNFTKTRVYPYAAAYLVSPAARALAMVADSLSKQGLGIILFDAYRPYAATVRFWELIMNEEYVAHPSKGSRHNRGCAVDLSLYDLGTGLPLHMPTDYDDFSPRAHANDSLAGTTERHNRKTLQGIMVWAGFEIFPTEWWHFDYRGWREWPLWNLSFDELRSH